MDFTYMLECGGYTFAISKQIVKRSTGVFEATHHDVELALRRMEIQAKAAISIPGLTLRLGEGRPLQALVLQQSTLHNSKRCGQSHTNTGRSRRR
jgi:hypothetical protein